MKVKLDENFGSRLINIFKSFDYDVASVLSQKLQGIEDDLLLDICTKEDRCLVTLDKDFTDIKRFSQKNYSGIVVFRTPSNPSTTILEKLAQQFILYSKDNNIGNNLWIVELGRIRIHERDADNS